MACQLTDCQDDFCETHGDYCVRCKRLRGIRCMCESDDAIRADEDAPICGDRKANKNEG